MSFPHNADLHCHSVVSDGTLTPEQLAARARANGVDLWSLTDHDEVGGQQRALEAARAEGLRYLTGVEVSVTFADWPKAWPTRATAAARAPSRWASSWPAWA